MNHAIDANILKNSWSFENQSNDNIDPLLECLTTIIKSYGASASKESLKNGLPLEQGKLSVDNAIRSAQRAGFSSKLKKRCLAKIPDLVLPAILLLKNKNACILVNVNNKENTAKIIVPELSDVVQTVSMEKLQKFYSGYVIYIKEDQKYDSRTKASLDVKTGHWFWGTILKSWKIYRDVLIASLLINLFVVLNPLFVMNVYDRVVPNLAFETLWFLAIGVAVAYVFDFILKMLRSYFIDLAGKKSDVILSSKIMEKVLGLKMKAKPNSVGSFARNLQDFESIRDFITSTTITTLVDLPFTLVILAIIFILSGNLALVPLVSMIIIGLYSFIIQSPLKASIEESIRSSAQKNATLIESLSGLEAVKINQAESSIQYKWEKAVSHIAHCSSKTKLITSSATMFSAFIQQVANVCCIVFGVYLIAEGELSMGGLIATVMLTGRCLAPMAQIAGLATRYNQSKASLTSLNDIMNLPSERDDTKSYISRANLKGDIQFEAVDFAYPDQESKILKNISITVKSGEKIGIIGRVGSGKTTIQKLLLNLYDPSEGSLLIDGIDINQINPITLRSNIGYMSQDIHLFYGSIRDNIKFGADHIDDEKVLKAAQISGVSSFTDKHPNGLDMIVAERGSNLSGGQRQSIALARAILLDPPIILLDEPSSSMDNTSEVQIRKRLKEFCKDKTVILVTHKSSMLDLVDRLIVMDHGKVVADGAKQQIHEALKQGKLKIN
jgi:ATP-binding cassette subfamily C protein LapB